MRVRWRLSLLIVLMMTVSVFADDWPQWRGPNGDGTTTEALVSTDWQRSPPKVLWRAQTGWAASNVSVADGKLYTVGFEQDPDVPMQFSNQPGKTTVYCLDAATGEEVWKQSFETKAPWTRGPELGGPAATPAVRGGLVFTLDRRGHLHCWSTNDGELVWHRDLAEERGIDWADKEQVEDKRSYTGFEGSPVVFGDRLFVNIGAHGMMVDQKTGETVWASPHAPWSHATPIGVEVGGEPALAMLNRESLVMIRQKDGEVLWSYPWFTRHYHNGADVIALPGQRFFIHSGYGRGGALVKREGGRIDRAWKQKRSPDFVSMVHHEGHLYGSGRCIRVEDGELVWFERALGGEYAGTILVGGKLLVQSPKGFVILAEASPEQYTELGRIKVFGENAFDRAREEIGGDMAAKIRTKDGRDSRSVTSPVFADGKVFVRNCAGEVVCLGFE